ncbi:AsmA family protein [Acetobacter conturbans]|uniref:AsmA family protein n=1 Tax=Acetobacter conturbans TaxID=1737472 RepID=A0ABX0JZW5_9PROT|nr:AsmA family protein [Acetobacter conturbans]NHN88545.1 AsmA family protein [Acetobacter conturbans]
MTGTSFPQRHRKLLIGVTTPVIFIILLIMFWSWDWFVPLVNQQATAALGRKTTIQHLHVHVGFVPKIIVDDVLIEQPEAFSSEKKAFFTADHLLVRLRLLPLLHGRTELPRIAVDTPHADIQRRADGTNNYTFTSDSDKKKNTSADSGFSLSSVRELEIRDGLVRVRDAKLRGDMTSQVHTTPPTSAQDRGTIVVNTTGRYAGQPIISHFTGGALLSLSDSKTPYPVDLDIRNGLTRATLKGSVDDPLAFRGTRLVLHFSGPDMSLLYPLTGVPIPQTPAYHITGKLDYDQRHISFENFTGQMGSSDLSGTITVDPHQQVPFVEATLHSHRVDIKDLGGFIGAKPGKETTSDKKVDAKDPNILPDTPINVPKLRAINAHVTYKGDHIENKELPLDDIDAEFAVQDGAIDLKKLNFGIGKGTLASTATLTPVNDKNFAVKAKVDFSRIDLAHIMRTTTGTQAQGGIIGGRFSLNATGNSIASLMANGNGGLTLVLVQGGEISALLPAALGLELGDAVLSALGLPSHTKVECFVADMPLHEGVATTNSLLLRTGDTRTLGRGDVNFRTNRIDYSLTTRSIGPTILSFPGAFNITGPLKSPSVLPGAEIIARAAAATGLGFVFPPLALLPTIQLGVGKGSMCEQALQEVNAHPASGHAPGGTDAGQTGKSAHRMTAAEVRAAWKKKRKH